MRGLALLGLVVFAIAWFVPVHEALDATDDVADAVKSLGERAGVDEVARRYRGPPGWRACRAAWELESSKSHDNDLTIIILRSTSLTNVVMLIAAIALLAGVRSKGALLLGTLLFICAILNAGWLYQTDAPFREGLEVGYWLWLGSFAVVGVGLLSTGRRLP